MLVPSGGGDNDLCMTKDDVLQWLEHEGTKEVVEGMKRYGIPNDRAFGVAMGDMKRYAKKIGKNHQLALALWETGWYEARTIAAFVDEAEKVTRLQMDDWASDFDSWAICDTTCFHLFDRTPFAWEKVFEWAPSPEEFVRRAAYALIWSLSVHDKAASNEQFELALQLIEESEPDTRPLVNRAIDMALRATGKRNIELNRAAIKTGTRLAASDEKGRAWIGRHALKELESKKVQERLAK